MLDKRICGARIVDGTGRPAYVGDVGIRAGRIVLHPQEEARQVLNARGLTLTPGLIDSHSHSDRDLGLDQGLRPVQDLPGHHHRGRRPVRVEHVPRAPARGGAAPGLL